jgi:uncharacterized protein
MDQKPAYDIIKDYLLFLKKNNFPVVKAFLFGSHAKGTYQDDSDIDLAVVLEEVVDRFDVGVQLAKLTRNVDIRIEPHPFDVNEFNISHPFAKDILQHGIQVS